MSDFKHAGFGIMPTFAAGWRENCPPLTVPDVAAEIGRGVARWPKDPYGAKGSSKENIYNRASC